jgi:hypothetical protein
MAEILVQNKRNPAVKRKIQDIALNTFLRKGWELASSEGEVKVSVQKKTEQVAAPAAKEDDGSEKIETIQDTPLNDGQPTIESLREEYEILAGKPADKRWNFKRLNEEIEKLKAQG